MCGESVSGIAASRLALKSALIAALLVVAPTADGGAELGLLQGMLGRRSSSSVFTWSVRKSTARIR